MTKIHLYVECKTQVKSVDPEAAGIHTDRRERHHKEKERVTFVTLTYPISCLGLKLLLL